MGNWRDHQRAPGTPPPRPRITEAELRAVDCENCQGVWFRSVSGTMILAHRFSGKILGSKVKEYFLCQTCGAQVDQAGRLLPASHEDRIPEALLLPHDYNPDIVKKEE
jgi:hypothetical protein